MELLIEVFLMLGREYRSAQPNQLVSDIIESCLSQANSRAVSYTHLTLPTIQPV